MEEELHDKEAKQVKDLVKNGLYCVKLSGS